MYESDKKRQISEKQLPVLSVKKGTKIQEEQGKVKRFKKTRKL